MTQFEFTDPKGMHFSQQMCQDVLDFMHAANELSNDPRGRDGQRLILNSMVGDANAVSTGAMFDEAISRLAAHFGLSYGRQEHVAKPAKKRKARAGGGS